MAMDEMVWLAKITRMLCHQLNPIPTMVLPSVQFPKETPM